MGFPNTVRIAHVVKFVLEEIILPLEIRAIVPLYFDDYAVRSFLSRQFPPVRRFAAVL